MIMKRLAVVLVIILAGCAVSGPPRVPEKVLVPVPVSCLEAPIKRPVFSSDAELKAMDSYHAMIALWLDRRLRGIYELQLEAAMAGCWQPASDGM